jgi:hypothetical protein
MTSAFSLSSRNGELFEVRNGDALRLDWPLSGFLREFEDALGLEDLICDTFGPLLELFRWGSGGGLYTGLGLCTAFPFPQTGFELG